MVWQAGITGAGACAFSVPETLVTSNNTRNLVTSAL
jgi:hypothetical protein